MPEWILIATPSKWTTGVDFWIVAIDHGLPLTRDADDPIKIGAQKDQLEVRFIAEESNIGKATIASVLASASNP
jgi:hypothetical protein